MICQKTKLDYEKPSPLLTNSFPNHNLPQPNRKKQKSLHIWPKSVELPLHEEMRYKFNSWTHFIHFDLHSSSMIFAVSNEGIQWSFDFDPDSVIPTVKNFVQEITISSQENPLPAWNLLLSQRQEFLHNHLVQIPITPNQQGTFEMRKDVLASAGAQDMNTSHYELADLEDIKFFWENPQMEMEFVFSQGILLFNNSLQRLGYGRIIRKPH